MKWNPFALISDAIEKTKDRVTPFSWREWLRLTVITTLGGCYRSGNINFSNSGNRSSMSDEQAKGIMAGFGNSVRDFFYSNSGFIAIMVGFFTIMLTVISYVKSVFSFIFIESLVSGRSDFTFRRNQSKGLSLFLFNAIVTVVLLGLWLLLASPYIYHFLNANPIIESVGWAYIIFTIVTGIMLSLVMWFWLLFFYDFVVPYMYAKDVPALHALNMTWREIAKSKMEILIYWLSRLVLGIATAVLGGLVFLGILLVFLLAGGFVALLGFLLYKLIGFAPVFQFLAVVFGIIWLIKLIVVTMVATMPLRVFLGYFGLLNFEKLTKIKIFSMKIPKAKALPKRKKAVTSVLVVLFLLTLVLFPLIFSLWYFWA